MKTDVYNKIIGQALQSQAFGARFFRSLRAKIYSKYNWYALRQRSEIICDDLRQ